MAPSTGPMLRVTDLIGCAEIGADEVLSLAASAVRSSGLEYAEAVLEHAAERGLRLLEPVAIEVESDGVRASVGGHEVRVGTLAFVEQHGWEDAPVVSLERYAAAGKTTVLVTVDGRPGAIMALRRPTGGASPGAGSPR